METTRIYGAGLPRGQGGLIGVLVLGGMETSLDEMEYIAEARREKKFVPQRDPSDIVNMTRLVLERRNDLIRHFRKNPSEAPKLKPRRGLYLPRGYRLVPTKEPGLKIVARV